MPVSHAPAPPGTAADPSQPPFLALLPTVRRVAQFHFRYVRCPARREDFVAEAVALAWAWYGRLAQKGRDPAMFLGTFARLAARAAGSGRRVCGQERGRDVLSAAGRRRRAFAVHTLPSGAPPAAGGFEDALADNTRSPVPDQAQFRGDFPVWKGRLSARCQRVVEQLALGHRTQDVARMFAVTPARVSQLRREFRRDYLNFLSGPPPG